MRPLLDEVKNGRLWWTCVKCRGRNNTFIPQTTKKNAPFTCAHCRKVQIFMFTPKVE